MGEGTRGGSGMVSTWEGLGASRVFGIMAVIFMNEKWFWSSLLAKSVVWIGLGLSTDNLLSFLFFLESRRYDEVRTAILIKDASR